MTLSPPDDRNTASSISILDDRLWKCHGAVVSIIYVETGWAELGQVIRKHRLAAGLSQEQLAERSGLHWTYVSQIESGKRNLSVNVLRRIAGALETPASTLIADAESESPHN